jgi:hypothetical protein
MKCDLRRHGLVWPFVILASACEGEGAPNPPEMSTANVSTDDLAGGNAAVTIEVNQAPKILAMSSDTGRVSVASPMELAVSAIDADGDPLTFAWSTECKGSFESANQRRARFVPGSLPDGEICEFLVIVKDGRGGRSDGTLRISSARPVVITPLVVEPSYQSMDRPGAGDRVLLRATATAQGSDALTWVWTATGGELLDQDDDVGQSEVVWRAPAEPGSRHVVSAMAAHPAGPSATINFHLAIALPTD